MRKLVLINPKCESGVITFNEPLGLGIIAALTPDNYEVEIIDEHFEDFNYMPCDIVGITSTTASINRAYSLSKIYMDKGIPVIMGGIHASLLPEEAIIHCTSVVIGEVELFWEELINDFERSKLKKFYGTLNNQTNRKIISPERSIFKKYQYPVASIETSRGCPNKCSYCSVVAFYKSSYYERPAEDIIEEIKKTDKKLIFFTDDNFIGNLDNKTRIIQILTSLISLKKKWYAYATISIINHPDLLILIKKSGCVMLFIGFETDNKIELEHSGKLVNSLVLKNKNIDECVKILHKYRIPVMGGFIYGLDSDNIETMSLRLEYIFNSRLNWFSICLLTPYPETYLHKRLKGQNRLTHHNYPDDWHLYNYTHVLYKPKNFSSEELTDFFIKSSSKYYTEENVKKLLYQTISDTRSLKKTYYFYVWVANHWKSISKFKIMKTFFKICSVLYERKIS